MMMATCWLLNEVGVNMLFPYKARFQPKFSARDSTEDGTNNVRYFDTPS